MATTAAPVDTSNAEIVRWAFDQLNNHDANPIRQFWTANTVERFPDQTCRGPDEIVAYFDALFAAVPDFHMDIVGMAAQDEHVFVQWHLTGTHRGKLLGVDPTGKPLAVDGIDHFVFGDGKLVSNFVVMDQLQYARQIGLLPPDGSAADKALKSVFNVRTKVAARVRR